MDKCPLRPCACGYPLCDWEGPFNAVHTHKETCPYKPESPRVHKPFKPEEEEPVVEVPKVTPPTPPPTPPPAQPPTQPPTQSPTQPPTPPPSRPPTPPPSSKRSSSSGSSSGSEGSEGKSVPQSIDDGDSHHPPHHLPPSSVKNVYGVSELDSRTEVKEWQRRPQQQWREREMGGGRQNASKRMIPPPTHTHQS
jgi:hypothetical protein